MGMLRKIAIWVLASPIVAVVLLSGPASADDGDDHERARHALTGGNVAPLALILEKVESLYPGRVIEVELESEGDDGEEPYVGGFLYEIKLLTPQGDVLKIYMDAATTELMRVVGPNGELPVGEQVE